MSFQSPQNKPTLLTPQELLLSQLPGLLSLWKHDRYQGRDAYRTAQDIAFVWSGLQRLELSQCRNELISRVGEIIRNDTGLLLEAIISHSFDFESWLREMEQLDKDWDLGHEEAEELEWRTHEAFDALDRTQLFAWFAATKIGSNARVQAWVESAAASCEAAERFTADRPDLFLCLATDLAAVIACSRPGLEETDPLLWETLGKHRRIEEARDEVELTASRHAVLTGVSRVAPRLPSNKLAYLLQSRAGELEPHLAMAAAPEAKGPTIGSLQLAARSFPVADELDIRVEFDLGPSGLTVWLAGRPETVRRYARVEVSLPGLGKTPLQASFRRSSATVSLSSADLKLLAACSPLVPRVVLVDHTGRPHVVSNERSATHEHH